MNTSDYLNYKAESAKKGVPHLESEGHDLEDKFKSKYSREDKVEYVQGMSVYLWLPAELHG